MKFVLLIIGSNRPYDELSDQDTARMYAEHKAFGAMLRERNALADGAELSYDGRIVTPQGGERIVTSGPFSETVERIGGYYVVEAADLDAAAELARHVPVLASDHVEVRPIKE